MLGPLLAMPSGQGLNMTILAILKVNRANWLLVLEIKLELRKNVSTIDKISLLAGQHYNDTIWYKMIQYMIQYDTMFVWSISNHSGWHFLTPVKRDWVGLTWNFMICLYASRHKPDGSLCSIQSLQLTIHSSVPRVHGDIMEITYGWHMGIPHLDTWNFMERWSLDLAGGPKFTACCFS